MDARRVLRAVVALHPPLRRRREPRRRERRARRREDLRPERPHGAPERGPRQARPRLRVRLRGLPLRRRDVPRDLRDGASRAAPPGEGHGRPLPLAPRGPRAAPPLALRSAECSSRPRTSSTSSAPMWLLVIWKTHLVHPRFFLAAGIILFGIAALMAFAFLIGTLTSSTAVSIMATFAVFFLSAILANHDRIAAALSAEWAAAARPRSLLGLPEDGPARRRRRRPRHGRPGPAAHARRPSRSSRSSRPASSAPSASPSRACDSGERTSDHEATRRSPVRPRVRRYCLALPAAAGAATTRSRSSRPTRPSVGVIHVADLRTSPLAARLFSDTDHDLRRRRRPAFPRRGAPEPEGGRRHRRRGRLAEGRAAGAPAGASSSSKGDSTRRALSAALVDSGAIRRSPRRRATTSSCPSKGEARPRQRARRRSPSRARAS